MLDKYFLINFLKLLAIHLRLQHTNDYNLEYYNLSHPYCNIYSNYEEEGGIILNETIDNAVEKITDLTVVEMILRRRIRTNNTLFFVYLNIFTFYEKMIDKNIYLINRNVTSMRNKRMLKRINIIYLKILKIYRRSVYKFRVYNFLRILFLSFLYKDMLLLKSYIQRRLSHISFKKYSKVIYLFRYSFFLITKYFIKRKIIFGFSYLMTGKVGLAGNARTKKKTLGYGIRNLSQKKYKIKYEMFQIWTKTGATGIKIHLIY